MALLEDRLAVAQAFALLLDRAPGLVFAGHAATEQALVQLLNRAPVDVLLIDIDLDGADGIEIGDRLARRWPRTGLVVLAGVADEGRLAQAIRIGALGWVPKTADPADLIAAIHGALRDETHVPPAMLTGALRLIVGGQPPIVAAPPPDGILDRLTPRERDVLDAMLQGRSRSDIATWLGMSPHTVRTHTQNIFRALGVGSGAAAVALARRVVARSADRAN